MKRQKHLATLGVLAISLLGGTLSSANADSGPATIHFEQEIRPVLVAECLKCHGPKKQKGGLRLDSRAAILKGGDSGPALEPGKPEASLLISALRYTDLEMPPENPLPEKTVAHFVQWIAAGAPWPDSVETLRPGEDIITEKDRAWWAFQPLADHPLPAAIATAESRNPIDRFVHARLAEKQMEPAPEADSTTLVRRLYLNLLGLPPTPNELAEYESNTRPDRWEQLVDRLLADPRYGEQWSRFWLDLVRYSDSDGWNQDAFRPHIWRYRDYVINAFNTDKPYPVFVQQQLAGDEISPDDPEALTATGFLRLGIYEYNQRDARGHWNDIMNEMTDVAGDVFFGMSMACARCHNHKFDPVLQEDYFKLRSFFEPVIWRDDLKAAAPQQHENFARQQTEWEEATIDIRNEIDALLKPYYDRKWKTTVDKFPLDIQDCFNKPVAERTSLEHQMAYLVSRQFLEEGGGPLKSMSKEDKAKHEALKEKLAAYDHLKPKALPPLMAATSFDGELSPTTIPDDPDQAPVQPGFLTVLTERLTSLPSKTNPPRFSAGRRKALAQWIGDASNPLTPRVIVNRIWQQHFGRGLVATPNDFGHNGEAPTHPQLLDWLTKSFINHQWSPKHLHRTILTSATWKQSADHPKAENYQELDPGDDLLWRHRVRRLKAEQIRDAMLHTSGELINRVGGPSIDEKVPGRALYVKHYRNRNDTLLHAFDLTGGLKSVADRNTTTTPTQSLLMINGDYVLQRAKHFSEQLLKLSQEPPVVVAEAIRRCWNRPPTTAEIQHSVTFISNSEKNQVDPTKLQDFCHVLFNSNEFLYLQ